MKNKLRKMLSFMLASVMLVSAVPMSGFAELDIFSIAANAAEEETVIQEGNFYYTVRGDEAVLVKSMAKSVPETLGGYPVTTIGAYAFESYHSMMGAAGSITLPDSVHTIEDYAFYKLYNLNEISVPKNLEYIGAYAFSGCYNLKNFTVTNCQNLKEIGSFAFEDCSYLQYDEFVIPANVEKLGYGIFGGCDKILSISVSQDNRNFMSYNGFVYDKAGTTLLLSPSYTQLDFTVCDNYATQTLTKIGDYAFYKMARNSSVGAFAVAPTVKEIGAHAFEYAADFASIIITSNVEKIGEYAFHYSKFKNFTVDEANEHFISSNGALYSKDGKTLIRVEFNTSATFTVSSPVNSIAKGAFSTSSRGASTVVIENDVTALEPHSFEGLYTNYVTIAEGVTEIGEKAFLNARINETITLPTTLKTVAPYAFSGVENLAEVVFHEGLETLGEGAFYNSCVEYITTPSTLKSIGDYTFYGSELYSITLSEGLETIGDYAFYDMMYLDPISFPSTLKKIGAHAFEFNPLAFTLHEGLEEIGDYAFAGCSYEWQTLNIPSTLKKIGNGAFASNNFTEIIVAKNANFQLYDELLLDAEGKTVVAAAFKALRTNYDVYTLYQAPEGIEEIQGSAFEGASLRFIKWPSTLTTIGERAFCNVSATEIIIPENVQTIGKEAFKEADINSMVIQSSDISIDKTAFDDVSARFNYIYYVGTEAEWAEIVKDIDKTIFEEYDEDDGLIVNIEVHCNYEIAESLSITEETVYLGTPNGYNSNTHQLTVEASPKDVEDYDVFWRTRSSQIATVDENGVVTAQKNGTVEIIARTPGLPWAKCNVIVENTSLFYYDIVDGEAIIVGFSHPNGGIVTIPETILDNPVTAIAEGAFENCYNITRINMPSTLKRIEKGAFKGCTSLEYVYYTPSDIEYIAPGAFEGCTSLVKIYGDENGTPYEVISTHIYYHDPNTGNLTLSHFVPLYSVNSFGVHENIKAIGESAFISSNLKYIYLHDSIKSIGAGAFKDASKLITIEIPSAVDVINEYTFAGCNNLESIVLTDSITEIKAYAFSDCSRLMDIYFTGTQAQWEAITVGEGNEILTSSNVTVHFGYVPTNELILNKDEISLQTGSTFDIDFVTQPENATVSSYEVWSTEPSVASVDKDGVVTAHSKGTARIVFRTPEGIVEECAVTVTDAFFLYEMNEDGTGVLITGLVDKTFAGEFAVPSTLDEFAVTGIGNNAFDGCTNVTGIRIPKEIQTIGDNAFTNCPSLTKVGVNEHSDYFMKENGVIYNADKTELIYLIDNAETTDFIVPDTVTRISGGAFCNNSSLIKVTIPTSVTEIGANAFKTVDDIYYSGTAEEWEKINIAEPNRAIDLAEIHFSYVPISGITFTLDEYVLKPGESTTIVPICQEGNNLNTLTWTSSDESIIEVSKTGVVTSVAGSGTAIITVTTREGVSATTKVTVYPYKWHIEDNEITVDGILDTNLYVGEIVIPENINSIPVTKIADDAFRNQIYITSISIPSSVETIGQNALEGCVALENITVAAENQKYFAMIGVLFDKETNTLLLYPAGKKDVFYMVFVGTETIGKNAFSGNPYLQSVIITSGVKAVSNSAFENCTALESVTMHNGLEKIGPNAFSDCSSLKSIIIPATVKNIGEAVFSGCKSLVSAVIGENGMTKIADEMFYDCENLENLTIPSTVTKIGNASFFNCDKLTSIPNVEKLTSIGDKAFMSCDGFTGTLTIRAAWEYVGESAFEFCKNITSVTIESGGLTEIPKRLFAGCKKLETLNLPADIATVSYMAFNDCSALSDVYYASSKAEWKAIVIDNQDYGNQYLMIIATIHCDEDTTDGIMKLTGNLNTSEYGTAIIELIRDGETSAAYHTEVTGSGVQKYTVDGITEGTYTVKVSKPGFVSKEYTLIFTTSDLIFNVSLQKEEAEDEIILGDLSGDGKVSITDLAKLNAYLSSGEGLTEAELKAADVTGDGKVNLSDLAKINSYLCGLTTI